MTESLLAEKAGLPLAAATALLGVAVWQLMLPIEAATVPAAETKRQIANLALAPVGPMLVPEILTSQPIFAPTRSQPIAAAIASGPLNGASIAGYVSVRGRRVAVIQQPDRSVVRLALGGIYAGWRLQQLAQDSASFAKDGKTIQIPYGSAANMANNASENEMTEDQQ